MLYETLRTGTKVYTLEGHLICTGSNGRNVYVDRYEIDDDGNAALIGPRSSEYTLDEIAHEAKAYDGKTRRYRWEFSCPDCCYYWKDDGDRYACCHFDRNSFDTAPCEDF